MDAHAFGRPGLPPTWTSSAKDLVTTALGPSRLWATLGHGIVNEVYWPATGQPQIRDLGFIVAGDGFWTEVKRAARYRLGLPAPAVPLPTVTHEGDRYRLSLELLPDPARDALLVSYRLDGDRLLLYALLAPHLGANGWNNTAWIDGGLFARSASRALCLLADPPFRRASAGYVGHSDGWQDFARNGCMTYEFRRAEDGNVALMGELASAKGVLALGFAETPEGARTLAASSLAQGYAPTRERFIAGWEAWGRRLRKLPAPTPALGREGYLSAVLLRAHEDRSFPGALVASLSIPWGNTRNDPGGYHLVWTRDAVEAAFALVASGEVEDGRRVLAYLVATQNADGSWCQNFFPDGRAFWTAIQLDEVGLPILLAAKLRQEGVPETSGELEMVRRAAAYIARAGPLSEQDRWEENAGANPFTLAVEIAALVAGADYLAGDDRAYALSLADCWNERIEEWTYVRDTELSRRAGVEGYYVRVSPLPADGGLCGRVTVHNRSHELVQADALVGLEFIYLARLGLRRGDDPRIRDSAIVADALLRTDTPSGPAYHRYNGDGYGEHEDGSPFDGTGVGRGWPLLTGERGHLALLAGEDPLPYLEAMVRMSGVCGLLPEQVWDSAPIEERGLLPGRPTGSAMPLVWAHAEFLKLLLARASGRPVELLESVAARYRAKQPAVSTCFWRSDVPIDALPRGRAIVIEDRRSFSLHFGFDGWYEAQDRESAPLGLGMHGVRIEADELGGRQALDFTRFYPEASVWEGHEHHVALAPPERDSVRDPEDVMPDLAGRSFLLDASASRARSSATE